MRVSIWQQFSSNNSSSFTVVGVFDTPETAQRAAAEVRNIIEAMKVWHKEHPEEGDDILRSGGYPPTPAEVEVGKRFGFDWEQAVEWYWYVSVEVILDRFVYIRPADFRPDTAGEPFDKILSGLGGQGLLHGNSYGDQIGTILAEVNCVAPDEATAQELVNKYLDWDHFSRAEGRHLHFYDWTFSEFDLPEFIDYLKSRGCTDIQYRLYQAENPGGKRPTTKDVDLLIQILESGKPWDIEEIANALGEIGDPRAVDALIHTLDRASTLARLAITSALGDIGDARAVNSLIGLLSDRDVLSAARPAASALAKIGDPRAIEPLVQALRNDRAYENVIEALASFGDEARETLNRNRANADGIFASRIEQALQRLDTFQQGGHLLAELYQDDATTRRKALEQVVARRDLDILFAYLQHPTDSETYTSVIKALAQIGDPRAIQPLSTTFGKSLSHAAFDALITLGAAPVEMLIQIFNDEREDWNRRQSALFFLGRLGNVRSIDIFLRVVEGKEPFTSHPAVEGLAKIHDPRAVIALNQQLLRDIKTFDPNRLGLLKNALVQQNALVETIALLIKEFKQGDFKTQSAIMWWLSTYAGEQAVPPLLRLRDEVQEPAKKLVVDALQRLTM